MRFVSQASKPDRRVYPDDLVIISQTTWIAFNLASQMFDLAERIRSGRTKDMWARATHAAFSDHCFVAPTPALLSANSPIQTLDHQQRSLNADGWDVASETAATPRHLSGKQPFTHRTLPPSAHSGRSRMHARQAPDFHETASHPQPAPHPHPFRAQRSFRR